MVGTLERVWLAGKFREIEKRLMAALAQLSDEQVNWRPDPHSMSIANLIVHIEGNIEERIGQGMYGREGTRNREAEFAVLHRTKEELEAIVARSFGMLKTAAEELSDEDLQRTQRVRGKERTNLEILLQCSAHFSEHLGQVLYAAKMLLGERYRTTSI